MLKGVVYSWVPQRQIWVERNIDPQELPYIIAHEYLELRLMRDSGLDYDRAHEICAEMEFALREAARRTAFPGLSRRRLMKADLRSFTRSEFFDYVHANYARSFTRRARAL